MSMDFFFLSLLLFHYYFFQNWIYRRLNCRGGARNSLLLGCLETLCVWSLRTRPADFVGQGRKRNEAQAGINKLQMCYQVQFIKLWRVKVVQCWIAYPVKENILVNGPFSRTCCSSYFFVNQWCNVSIFLKVLTVIFFPDIWRVLWCYLCRHL